MSQSETLGWGREKEREREMTQMCKGTVILVGAY